MTSRLKMAALLILALPVFCVAQRPLPFRGSFLMSFNEEGLGQKKAWPFQCTTDISKTGLEIKDDMNKKGVLKRILYNEVDSTWLMLIGYNKVKQATLIHARAMFSNKMKSPVVITKPTGEKKVISGYTCMKYITVSENDSAVVWASQDLQFDLGRLYKMLSHCGMMSSYVDEGTWFYSRKIKGMVLEVTSFTKKTGAFYTMNISDIRPNEINESYFDISGYRISNIPEGENCGPAAKLTEDKK